MRRRAVIDLREPIASGEGEEELLQQAVAGDRDAFEALYLRHHEAAKRLALACTTSVADAEDAVAEAFVRVFAKLPRLAGRHVEFRAYLLAAVRNAAMDGHRRAARFDLRGEEN